MLHVASVAVFDRKGRLLFGLRKDSWKWNLPGGHVEKGEDYVSAAQRELHEETGILVPKHKLEYLGSETFKHPDLGKEITVHCYKTTIGIDQIPTTKNDPDKECVCWKWVDVSDGIPDSFAKRLHNTRDSTLCQLGLQKSKLKKDEDLDALAEELDDFRPRTETEKEAAIRRLKEALQRDDVHTVNQMTGFGQFLQGSLDDQTIGQLLDMAFRHGSHMIAQEALSAANEVTDGQAREALRLIGAHSQRGLVDSLKLSSVPTSVKKDYLNHKSEWVASAAAMGMPVSELEEEYLAGRVSAERLVEKKGLSTEVMEEVVRRQDLRPTGHFYSLEKMAANNVERVGDNLFRALRDHADNIVMRMMGRSKALSPELVQNEVIPYLVERANSDPSDARILEGWAGREDLSEANVRDIFTVAKQSNELDPRLRSPGNAVLGVLFDHPLLPEEMRQDLIENAADYGSEVKMRVHQHFPDAHYKERVAVKAPFGTKKFGLNALRKLRDFVASQGGKIHKSLLEKEGRHPGKALHLLQDAKGYISAEKIQEFIDNVEATEWNVGHSEWTGIQRHSDENSRVFQLNLTNDHVQRLKEAGVYDTFRRMYDASYSSFHPVTPATIGWVRYTESRDPRKRADGTEALPGILIDEIQSDLGQSFVRQAASQARAQGLDPKKAAEEAEKQYPEEHFKKISEILFGGRHPNEVLYDAFLQYMRDTGRTGLKVSIHTPETKAPLAQMDSTRPIPGHMRMTYGELPQRFGFEPSKYGTLATESNESLFGKPMWGDEVRKKEEELAKMAFDPQHLSAIRSDSVKKGRKIIASPETHQIPEPVLPYRQLFDERLRNSTEVAQPRWKSPGGIGTKVVYDADDQPFLLKPYHEDPLGVEYAMVPMYGWAELTSQDMYHAGGIGDLHQKVFLTDYDVGGERVPMIAIAMDPDMRVIDDLLENKDPLGDPQKDHPRLRKDVAKIAFMDFLTGNLDRHGSNLMWGYKDGVPNLLSIDHGRSFQYLMGAGDRWGTHHDPDKLNRDYLWHYNVGTKGYWPLHDIIGESWDDEALEDAVQWWTANREKIVGAFARNLKAVKSPVLRYHLARNLRDRKKVLDRFAEDWQTSGRAAAAYLPPNDEGEDLDDIQSVKLYPFYWWKV